MEQNRRVVANFWPGARCICCVPSFWYFSHVRFFTSAQEVVDRYSDLFDDFDVLTLPRQKKEGYNYLFEGCRNQNVVP